MSRDKEIIENPNHPLPKKGDLIRITDVHCESGKPSFNIGDLIEVKDAWKDKKKGMVYFRAKADCRKHVMTYSSKTYDWEIFGEEYETILKAQEKTGEFVHESAEKRFEEIWENWRRDKVFPEQFFETPKAKWMFAMVFYQAFEDGWNACCMHSMDDAMRNVELCINELGKLTGVKIKEGE